MKTTFSIILALIITACGNNPPAENISFNVSKETIEDSSSTNHIIPAKDRLDRQINDLGSFFIETTKNYNEHPFTYNPSIIYFKSNIISFDSLKSYFRYKDVKRLDHLVEELSDWHNDSLYTIRFQNQIIVKDSDTLFLMEYQFLVGNLKINEKLKILIIIDLKEAKGHSYLLMSINEDNSIIDFADFYSNYGDGGGFINTKLFFRNINRYEIEVKDGYQTYSRPFDTITYDLRKDELVINNDGKFLFRNILEKYNLMEIKPYE
jgi:hypothetical protein